MIDLNIYEDEIKPLTKTEGWKIILNRLNIILNNADRKIHSATRDNFEYSKGFYDAIKIVYEMFAEPKNFVSDGVISVSPAEKEKGG